MFANSDCYGNDPQISCRIPPQRWLLLLGAALHTREQTRTAAGFYLRIIKGCACRFSGERPAQQSCWWGESSGVSPLSLLPCPSLERKCAVWQGSGFFGFFVRQVPFAMWIPNNVCSPVTSSKLHSLGSSLVLHGVMWTSCMFWRGGVGTTATSHTALQPEKHSHSSSQIRSWHKSWASSFEEILCLESLSQQEKESGSAS